MKIAIDARSLSREPAGKDHHVRSFLRALAAENRQIEYILYTERRQDLGISFPVNFKVRPIIFPGIFWHLAVWLDLLLITRPDIYFTATSTIIPSLPGVRTAMVVHDLVALCFPLKHDPKAVKVEKATLPRALRRARKIITVSNYTRNDITRLFPKIPAAKIKTIYPAPNTAAMPLIDQKQLQRVLKRYRLPQDYVLFLATLEPRKNVTGLIKAFNYFKNKYSELPGQAAWSPPPSSLKLVIAGKKGWHYQEIFDTVIKLGLEKDVVFTGYFPNTDAPFLYAGAKAFIFPSFFEGFGIPPLEAMGAGVPVITSRVSSLPEVCGKAAVYIDPHRPWKIAAALKKVLGDPQLRATLIRAGKERRKKFSWKRNVRETLAWLED